MSAAPRHTPSLSRTPRATETVVAQNTMATNPKPVAPVLLRLLSVIRFTISRNDAHRPLSYRVTEKRLSG